MRVPPRRFRASRFVSSGVKLSRPGFLANRVRERNLALARQQLHALPHQTIQPEQVSSPPRCPSCHLGTMITIETIDPQPPHRIDSS